jgi:hypothetical protein
VRDIVFKKHPAMRVSLVHVLKQEAKMLFPFQQGSLWELVVSVHAISWVILTARRNRPLRTRNRKLSCTRPA